MRNERPQTRQWRINTSNQGKLKEFQRLFAKHQMTLSCTSVDLHEIDADPVKVIAHKASQLEEFILVEDTSLDIEGASVGINVRWLIAHLDQFIGRKASWQALLGYRKADKVFIFKGEVHGTIVSTRGGDGFGFDPFFLPENSNETLAESKPDKVNARALAVEALVDNELYKSVEAIYEWEGPWQKD